MGALRVAQVANLRPIANRPKRVEWLIAGLLATAAIGPSQTLPAPTFSTGTRLVEVEVVVRTKDGPVKNLTQDNFIVLDQGKPQKIAVFRAGATTIQTSPVPLPPGGVSNRVDSRGEPLAGATVVLFDQLNASFSNKGYERVQIVKFLRSLASTDRVAVYALGKSLHVLQDFTDDPQKLLNAVTKLDQGRDLLPANLTDPNGFSVLDDFPDRAPPTGDPRTDAAMEASRMSLAGLNAQINAAENDLTTIEALRRIIHHLAGMPGRRSLVWLKELPQVPPEVMGMLQQSGIALYPVLVRNVLYTNPDILGVQRAVRDLGAATGGAAFADAGDLSVALQTAEEDSRTAYTLGYYPAEENLDGKYHRLTVNIATGKLTPRNWEVRYRPGYVAVKNIAPQSPPTFDELFENPLDSTTLGLAAQTQPDAHTQGFYQVRLTIDLHEVHLERQGDHSVGAVEVGFLFTGKARVRTIHIDLTDHQLAQALENGFVIDATGLEAVGGDIHVAVRDPSNGAAGSLKIPIGK